MSLSEGSASQKFKSLLPAASTFYPFQDVALDSMVSMLLIFQSEKLRNRSRDMIWVPQCSDNMPLSRIHTMWCCCPVISLKMPTGAGKACNQRSQSLMSREGGNTGPTGAFCIWEPLTWTRVKRTRREGHWERKMDRQERTGEKGGVSIVRKRLCCSWSLMARLGQEEGQSQRAPELKS